MDQFCIYETKHPTGFVYRGKSTVSRILSGYKGSGRKLKEAMKHTLRCDWKTTIIEIHHSETDCFSREKQLVGEIIDNEMCLNIYSGGAGRFIKPERPAIMTNAQRNKKKREDKAARLKAEAEISILARGPRKKTNITIKSAILPTRKEIREVLLLN